MKIDFTEKWKDKAWAKAARRLRKYLNGSRVVFNGEMVNYILKEQELVLVEQKKELLTLLPTKDDPMSKEEILKKIEEVLK